MLQVPQPILTNGVFVFMVIFFSLWLWLPTHQIISLMNEWNSMCESFINRIHLIKSFRLLKVFSFIRSLTLASTHTHTICQNGIDDAKVLTSAISNWLSSISVPSFTELKYSRFFAVFLYSNISQNKFIYFEFMAVARYHIKLVLFIIGPDREMNVSNKTNLQQSPLKTWKQIKTVGEVVFNQEKAPFLATFDDEITDLSDGF